MSIKDRVLHLMGTACVLGFIFCMIIFPKFALLVSVLFFCALLALMVYNLVFAGGEDETGYW